MSRQVSWDAAVRYRPSADQVRRHLAYCREQGIDAVSSCVERWGWVPVYLIRMAPRPRRAPKGSADCADPSALRSS